MAAAALPNVQQNNITNPPRPELRVNDTQIPADLNEGHPGMYWKGVVVTILSCAGYVLPFFVTFPLAAAVQIVALGVLTAVTYGIVNDLIACKKCIEYFTVGHTQFHKRLIKSDNPTKNAIVWGIHATWKLGLIAGSGLAIAARITGLAAVTALHLTPFALALSIGTCLVAHYAAKGEEAKWSRPEKRAELNRLFNRILVPHPGYHLVDLRRVPENKRAAYEGVGTRNGYGYFLMLTGGASLFIATIMARILTRSLK